MKYYYILWHYISHILFPVSHRHVALRVHYIALVNTIAIMVDSSGNAVHLHGVRTSIFF